MICACILTNNDEATISLCIQSVKDKVDEILVVDSYSEDMTVSVAKSLGANVYNVNWIENRSIGLNFVIENSKSSWVFIINPDEVLDNLTDLRLFAISHNQNLLQFCLVEASCYSDKGILSAIKSNEIRLIHKSLGFRFHGIIYENIKLNDNYSKLETKQTDILIHKNKFKLSSHNIELNLKLLNIELNNNPASVYYLLYKAKILFELRKVDESIDMLRYIASSDLSNLWKSQSLNILGDISINQGNYDLALQYYDQSIELNQFQTLPYVAIAYIKDINQDNFGAFNYLNMIGTSTNNDINYCFNFIIPDHELIFYKSKYLILIHNLNKAKALLTQNQNLLTKHQNLLFLYSNVLLKLGYIWQSFMIMRNLAINNQNENLFSDIYSKLNSQIINQSIPLLSLCMIVKNEENFLSDCLDSISEYVDEIIIVDTGSTDNTVNIANKFTDNIYHFNWVEDFSLARNECLKYAKGKWILYLDADERIDIKNANLMLETLKNVNSEIGAINCIVESNIRKSGGNTDKQRGIYPRLFRNYAFPYLQFRGAVHEQIIESVIECGGEIFDSKITIQHLGYNVGEESINQKSLRNLNLLKSQLLANPQSAYDWFQMSNTLLYLKKYDEAYSAMFNAVDLGTLAHNNLASAYNTLSQLSGLRKDFAKALEFADKSISLVKSQYFAHILKSEALRLLGNKNDAHKVLEELLSMSDFSEKTPSIGYDIDITPEIIKKYLLKLEES